MKTLNKTMKIFIPTLFLALLLVNCSDKKEAITDNVTPVNVTIATPSTQQRGAYFSASGQIETEQFANISTRMMGYVSKVHVKVGDKVRKDQLLININNTDIDKPPEIKNIISIVVSNGCKNAASIEIKFI